MMLRRLLVGQGQVLPKSLKVPPVALVETTVEYRVRFWAETKFFWDAHNSVLEDLRTVFEEDGITMSYPHVNVHIMDEK